MFIGFIIQLSLTYFVFTKYLYKYLAYTNNSSHLCNMSIMDQPWLCSTFSSLGNSDWQNRPFLVIFKNFMCQRTRPSLNIWNKNLNIVFVYLSEGKLCGSGICSSSKTGNWSLLELLGMVEFGDWPTFKMGVCWHQL